MKKNKISLLITNLELGGAERVLVNMANELSLRGYDVQVVLIKAEGCLLQELSSEVRVFDLNSTRIIKAFPKLITYLKIEKPYAVIAFMWPLTIMLQFANFLVGQKHASKILVTEHCSWSTMEINSSYYRKLMQSTMRFFYQFADGVVTVSEGAKSDLINFANLSRDKINLVSIYNPVIDLKRKHVNLADKPKSWCEGEHQKILAVGNLKAIKDYVTMIKAFKIVHAFKKAKLLILGEGEQRQELTMLIRSLGLEEDCILYGQVQEPEAYYQLADLFVLSSKGEGLPTVLIEALSYGLKIVTTNCPSGPAEILANGQYGRLAPVGDVQQLAFEMINALDAPFDKKILQDRAKAFSIPKAVDAYLEILESVS